MEGVRGNRESFKKDLDKFREIDKKIKELNNRIDPLRKELRELNQKKLNHKQVICSFMDRNNIGKCEAPDNSSIVIYRKRKTIVPIKKDTIRDEIKRFFMTCNVREFNSLGADKKSEKIYDFIYKEDREYKYTDVLQNKIK